MFSDVGGSIRLHKMECKSSDSKKLFKVFDAAKHKRTRKKRDGLDDSTSVVTDGSAGVSICIVICYISVIRHLKLLVKSNLNKKSIKRIANYHKVLSVTLSRLK